MYSRFEIVRTWDGHRCRIIDRKGELKFPMEFGNWPHAQKFLEKLKSDLTKSI